MNMTKRTNEQGINTNVSFFSFSFFSSELKVSSVTKNLITKPAMLRPYSDVLPNFPLFGFRRYIR